MVDNHPSRNHLQQQIKGVSEAESGIMSNPRNGSFVGAYVCFHGLAQGHCSSCSSSSSSRSIHSVVTENTIVTETTGEGGEASENSVKSSEAGLRESREHDYIGLSEVNPRSARVSDEGMSESVPDLNFGETELRLGPPKAFKVKTLVADLPEEASRCSGQEEDKDACSQAEQKEENPQTQQTEAQKAWHSQISKVVEQQQAPFAEPRNLAKPSITGSKRPYSDAIVNVAMDMRPDLGAQQGKNQLMPPMFPWLGPKQLPASWRMGLEQSKPSFSPFPPAKASKPNTEANVDVSAYDTSSQSCSKKPAPADAEIPQASAPVVGWPPVQSFRKNTLVTPTQTKTTVERETVQTPSQASLPAYVKVYMDGVPVGRKVDLRVNNSYKKLSTALEDMFSVFIAGQNGSKGSLDKTFLGGAEAEYVLTYEDKDGDLMLVGDVPWGMFMGTVKRLRIMKGSEAIGLTQSK